MSLSISSHIHFRGNTMRFMTPEMFDSSTFSYTQKIQNTFQSKRKETFLAYCVSSKLGKKLRNIIKAQNLNLLI